jgi:hypothetical protein
MRSEELHRCAEHPGLSEVVIGSGYQLELLDPADPKDRADLRLAIVQPARNVFADWGLGECLRHEDAPFSPGMPALLMDGAACLSKELEHRPDQLPLLQHALQATWHFAMRRWSQKNMRPQALTIEATDLPGYQEGQRTPDLGECLNLRADDAESEAAQRFAERAGTTEESGEQALRAAFRALARRDDVGNWARRFADRAEITVFLNAESNSQLAHTLDEPRWTALEKALNSFLLRGYLNGGGTRDYDISHEALIRNWRKFQLWLRDPREVAYSLGRALKEVEEPEQFDKLSESEKTELIPAAVASRVAMVTSEGHLPTRWGQDQIATILQNSTMRARWGTSTEALAKVIGLARMADQARERAHLRQVESDIHLAQEQARIEARAAEDRARYAEEKAKLERRWKYLTLILAGLVCGSVILAGMAYRSYYNAKISQATSEASQAKIKASEAVIGLLGRNQESAEQ